MADLQPLNPSPPDLAAEALVAAIRGRLQFAAAEPFGDLQMNADRAAVIAASTARAAGWVKLDEVLTALGDDRAVHLRAAVASAYRAGQAAAPDGPGTWALPDGSATFYGIQWTEPNGQVFVVMQDSLQAARDEVAANAGHPKLLNMQVVQSWRTPWVPLTDATPADGQV